jgi:hypothetical protein
MKNRDMSNDIASSMDAILKDPEYKSMFSSSAVLEKLAFKRVADENLPTEIEVELANELSFEPLEAKASSPRADCVACGKSRAGWSESMGVCKCVSGGCSPMGGCKEGCSCNCKVKKAEVGMDSLIKSAFDSLMKASSDLEDAGLESLASDTLVLMGNLVVEAKKKKDKKDDKKDKEKADKEKAKEKADKEKAKAKAEKDKSMAKDKAMKEKAKEEADKAKAKAKAKK